jgi:hypothetical protein
MVWSRQVETTPLHARWWQRPGPTRGSSVALLATMIVQQVGRVQRRRWTLVAPLPEPLTSKDGAGATSASPSFLFPLLSSLRLILMLACATGHCGCRPPSILASLRRSKPWGPSTADHISHLHLLRYRAPTPSSSSSAGRLIPRRRRWLL